MCSRLMSQRPVTQYIHFLLKVLVSFDLLGVLTVLGAIEKYTVSTGAIIKMVVATETL